MAAVVNLVLKGDISANHVVAWVANSISKEEITKSLGAVDNLKAEFVPYLLNFLRDQSLDLVQTGQPGGQTPIKVKPKSRKYENNQKVSTPRLSRVQLFSESPKPTKTNDFDNGVVKFNKSARKNQQPLNDPRILKPELRSQQKFNLGQFIVANGTSNHRKRIPPIQKDAWEKVSGSEQTWSDARGSPTVPINLSDVHDFPPVGVVASREKEQRRITPTRVHVNENSLSTNQFISSSIKIGKQLSVNSAFSRDVTEEVTFDNSRLFGGEQRMLLVKNGNVRNNTSTPSASPQSVATPLYVNISPAEPHMITHKQELDKLIELYCGCVNENLVPNLCVELYFLMQLLTVRGKEDDGDSFQELTDNSTDVLYFESTHNCVYFAVQVLHRERSLLRLLDKATLRLLADNPRAELFLPALHEELIQMCETIKNKNKTNASSIPWFIGSVSFQSDTDNRNNFPGDRAFHVFRKQRDIFYELLREWEANYMNPNWSMPLRLGEKIRSLVNMWKDPVVYSHFARLYILQLCTMCEGNGSQNNQDSFCDAEFLMDLKKSNPEKFNRLQERFVTPYKVGGPTPLPSFYGVQEFFRDFIILAECPTLNQHLVDTLVFKILELNIVQFSLPETECEDNLGDKLRQHFTSNLLTLRLLAKFLGFIVFLPYRTATRLPQDVFAEQIAIRNRMPLILDLATIVKDSVIQCRTLVTIPWIVEFLSMMDAVAPFLDSLNKVLTFLINFYRCASLKLNQEEFSLNRFFILLLMGWLFESPNFPSTLFFVDVSDEVSQAFGFKCDDVVDGVLDSFPLIDHYLLYTCCPYLGEMKVLLTEFLAGIRSRGSTVKKITPIAANDTGETPRAVRQLQLQLEEHFFHNHPRSVRKTVDFVSERMTSNVIKYVRQHTIPIVHEELRTRLFSSLNYKFYRSDMKKINSTSKQILELSSNACNKVRQEVEKFSVKHCEERTDTMLKLLLPDETLPSIICTCSKIVNRLTKENVSQWIARHMTPVVFSDSLKEEFDKFRRLALANDGNPISLQLDCKPEDVGISYSSISSTDVIVRLKACTRKLYCDQETVSPCELKILLNDVNSMLLPSLELTSFIKKCTRQLSFELLIALVVFQPAMVDDMCMTSFVKCLNPPNTQADKPLLCHCSPASHELKCCCFAQKEASTRVHGTPLQILCSRNMLLLAKLSSNATMTWSKMECLLMRLLQEEMITMDEVADQGFRLLQQDWPRDVLRLLVRCLELLANNYFSQTLHQSSSQFLELLQQLYRLCGTG